MSSALIGAGGLSRMSVWLLKLDIELRFIPPPSPQANGGHTVHTRDRDLGLIDRDGRFHRFATSEQVTDEV